MRKLNSHSLFNCLSNKFPLMDSHTINNVNQQKLIIPYYSTTIGKRSELYARSKIRNGENSRNTLENHRSTWGKHAETFLAFTKIV